MIILLFFQMLKYMPKSTADRLAFGIFVFGGHFYLFYESYIVLPFYYPTESWVTPYVLIQYSIAAIFYMNIYGNLIKMILHKSELTPAMVNNTLDMSATERLKIMEEKDWHYCGACLHYAPPRSHHCRICKVCVLRRDHHCWFAGQCVGFLNHRYK